MSIYRALCKEPKQLSPPNPPTPLVLQGLSVQLFTVEPLLSPIPQLASANPQRPPRRERMMFYFGTYPRTDEFFFFLLTDESKAPLQLLPSHKFHVREPLPADEEEFDSYENDFYSRPDIKWGKNYNLISRLNTFLNRMGKCVLDLEDWRKFRRVAFEVTDYYKNAYIIAKMVPKSLYFRCEKKARHAEERYERKMSITCTEQEADMRKEMKNWMKRVLYEVNKISHNAAKLYSFYANETSSNGGRTTLEGST